MLHSGEHGLIPTFLSHLAALKLKMASFILKNFTFHEFSMFYCELTMGLWGFTGNIPNCFCLQFAQGPNFFGAGVVQ